MLLFNIDITEEACKSLCNYVDELLKWNKSVNLIGRSTEENIWETHIKDSLELYPYLSVDDCPSIIDIGSGGGIPAIPLSIVLPLKKFYLTEVDSKKLAFLEFMTNKLGLNASVEDINRKFTFNDKSLIISRAFSSVANIIKWGFLHAPGCESYYLLKGRENNLMDEIGEAGVNNYRVVPLDKGNLLIIQKEQNIREQRSKGAENGMPPLS